MITALVFRLDAGDQFGMGHLNRCLVLANEFLGHLPVKFIIKSDNDEKVVSFLHQRIADKTVEVVFLDTGVKQADDLTLLIKEFKRNKSFLILDHYSVDDDYQLFLSENNIKWLQFDSHGKMAFYADLVLHGSPGATLDIYEPLRRNPKTEFLLGTHYAIVGKHFGELRKQASIRNSVKKMMICFGGGNDRGATLNCLKSLDRELFKNIILSVITSSQNTMLVDVKKVLSGFPDAELLMDTNNIEQVMLESDLAILSPGMLSYEAACLGLPMLQITIADNQFMNAVGWQEKDCAEYVGHHNSYSAEKLNTTLKNLLVSKEKLEHMSNASFHAVDGQGAKRVKNKILAAI